MINKIMKRGKKSVAERISSRRWSK